MPQVLVWKCPSTGKLFLEKEDYQRHLRKLAKVRYEARTLEAYRRKSNAYIESTLWRAATFADIEAWFLDPENHLFLANRILRLNLRDRLAEFDPTKFRITEFRLERLQWGDEVSNSHSAPRGCRTNWGGRRPEEPQGYPGWSGRVRWKTENGCDIWTEIFDHTGIYTDGGGGAGNGYSHEVKLFDADWSFLAMWSALSHRGNRVDD